MSHINDESLLQEFVAESQEHLAEIEPHLLSLEEDGENIDSEAINSLFRALHSIKGSSSFFGLKSIKELSHTMENVFMLIRDGKLTPETKIVDALLAGVDKLNLMISDVKNSHQISYQEESATLEDMLNKHDEKKNTQSNSSVKKLEAPSFKPDREETILALSEGSTLFFLSFKINNVFLEQWGSYEKCIEQLTKNGTVLESIPHKKEFPNFEKALKDETRLSILYATSLDESAIQKEFSLSEAESSELDFMEVLEKSSENQEVPKTKEASEGSVVPIKQKPLETEKKSNKKNKGIEIIETVRVRVDLLNKLMNLAGEMVLMRNQLTRTLESEVSRIDGLATIMQNLDLTTTDLQEHIMQTRMQPVGNVFSKFPRVVRDMSNKLDKDITLSMKGEDVELDKSLIETLSDPLTHLIRNSCDHGIESKASRQEQGKNQEGTIQLKAYHEGGQINISIEDDGGGIDSEKIAQKAIENGLVSQSEVNQMSPKDKLNLIMLAGLSTAKEVSDLSGRGVGMDVVRNNIEKMGGQISLESTLGKGTKIILRLPLTLAIIPSLLVQEQGQRFAIPQVNLVELISVKANDINSRIKKAGSATVLKIRGKLLPLIRLSKILDLTKTADSILPNSEESATKEEKVTKRKETSENILQSSGIDLSSGEDYNIIVLKVGSHQYGLLVDEILDLEEIVVKALSSYLKECRSFSGSTIMGDGTVAMILDSAGLAQKAKLTFAHDNEEISSQFDNSQNKNRNENTIKKEVILFKNSEDEMFAVESNEVLRLERFSLDKIEVLSNQEYLTYNNKGLPLIRLENYLPVKAGAHGENKEAYLIIPRAGNTNAGIIATQILDVINVNVTMQEPLGGQSQGTKGSAIINDRLTLFIDPEGLMDAARINYSKTTENKDKIIELSISA